MKKYLFVIPSLSKGGAERVVSVLSNELCHQGKEVVVITHFNTENEYTITDKVKVVCLSGISEKQYRYKISFWYLLNLAYKLRKVILIEKPDYIFPFLWTTCIRTDIALLGSKYKRNVIQTVRNNPYVFPQNVFLQKYRNFLIKRSGLTIVQNLSQKNYFVPNLHKKIAVLPNPVTQELFDLKRKQHEKFNIIGVGRLEEQKNFELLIEAFSEIHKCYPDTHLKIFGDGSLRVKLQSKIDELQLQTVINLWGRSNSYEEIYSEADLFVLSSNFEGMPNTLLEAMAVGIPCISTDCPTGPKNIINADNGILIPVNSKTKLVKAIEFLLLNPNIAKEIAKKGKQTMETQYKAKVITKKLISIVEKKDAK